MRDKRLKTVFCLRSAERLRRSLPRCLLSFTFFPLPHQNSRFYWQTQTKAATVIKLRCDREVATV